VQLQLPVVQGNTVCSGAFSDPNEQGACNPT